jgi:hypothetical protein
MRVLILTIALLAYALPAFACDYNAQASSSDTTTTATSTPASTTSNSGG